MVFIYVNIVESHIGEKDIAIQKRLENITKIKMDNEQFAIFLEEIKRIQELLKQILDKVGSYT